MSMCEDFPCCGHESGCCPSYSDDGTQLDMKCVCGVSLPVDHHCSVCDSCLDDEFDNYRTNRWDHFEDAHYDSIERW